MAGLVAHDPDTRPESSDDTRSIPFPEARVRRWVDGPVIPMDRWLHSDTVDELRASRARLGLPVPRGLPPVTRAPLTALDPLHANLRGISRRGAPAADAPAVRSPGAGALIVALGASAAAVLGLGAGVGLALLAYVGHLPVPGA